MGTCVDAVFGHSGKAAEVEALCRTLVGYEPAADLGHPVLSAAAIEKEWARGRSFSLHGPEVLLFLYAREACLHHLDIRWWAFAQDGRMSDGRGRAEVRDRTRGIAARFAGDRILYLPDSCGPGATGLDGGAEVEEASLREHFGAPTTWDAPVPDEKLFACWFREGLG